MKMMDLALGVGIVFTTSFASLNAYGNEADAYRAAAEAAYKQTGMETEVQHIQNRLLPKKVQEVGGWVLTVGKIAQEKKVVWTWTF